MRRRLWLGGLLSLVLVGVVVYFAAQGGSGGFDPSSVAAAAERTSAEPGGSIEAEITYGVDGESNSVTATGVGVFDAHSSRARMELSVPGPDGSPIKAVTVSDEKTAFVSSPPVIEELPRGKAWLGMEPLLGQDPTTALSAGGGAKGSLEMLRAMGGDVERVGEESIRGENATQYKGTIDLSQAAKKFAAKGDAGLARLYRQVASRLSGPIPVEVWIGVGGLVRRERMIEQVSNDGGKPLEVHLSIELFDFAPHPDIELPRRNLVLDFTPVLRAELGLEDGSTLGSLAPPARAKPLAAVPFRRRAIAICRRVTKEGAHLFRQSKPLIGAMKGLGLDQVEEGKRLIRKFARTVGEPAVRITRRSTHELARLDPPASLAADFRRYLVLDAKQVEWNLAQTRVMELGSAKLPSLAGREAEEPKEKAERRKVASRLGLSICEREPWLEGQAQEMQSSLE